MNFKDWLIKENNDFSQIVKGALIDNDELSFNAFYDYLQENGVEKSKIDKFLSELKKQIRVFNNELNFTEALDINLIAKELEGNWQKIKIEILNLTNMSRPIIYYIAELLHEKVKNSICESLGRLPKITPLETIYQICGNIDLDTTVEILNNYPQFVINNDDLVDELGVLYYKVVLSKHVLGVFG